MQGRTSPPTRSRGRRDDGVGQFRRIGKLGGKPARGSVRRIRSGFVHGRPAPDLRGRRRFNPGGETEDPRQHKTAPGVSLSSHFPGGSAVDRCVHGGRAIRDGPNRGRLRSGEARPARRQRIGIVPVVGGVLEVRGLPDGTGRLAGNTVCIRPARCAIPFRSRFDEIGCPAFLDQFRKGLGLGG
jgi:hypothetical protein